MTRIIDIADLARGGTAYEFEGHHYGDTGVSFIVVDAPPGSGPRLHRHPYEEVFVVQEGSATFTAGDEVIEAGAGKVVVVPARRLTRSPHLYEHVSGSSLDLPIHECRAAEVQVR